MKASFFVCLLLLITGIQAYSQIHKQVTIKLSKADVEASSTKLAELVDEVSYIKLEKRDGVIIGDAAYYHLKKVGDFFCIYHSMCNEAILLFENDGKFRCKVGNVGKGPGEYSGVFTVHYDKYIKNIVVKKGKKIMLYDLMGNHVSTIRVDPKNAEIRSMAIVDDKHWMFTFFEPDRDDKIVAGVLMTDKNGVIIEKFTDFDRSIPGCSSKHSVSNRIYKYGGKIFFCPFDYNNTYIFNGSSWALDYVVEDPFRKPPKSLYKSSRSELMKFKIDNGLLMSVNFNYGRVIINGATPQSFRILCNSRTGTMKKSGYSMDFHMEGFENDIDGGIPFDINSIGDEGYSYNLIDSPKLLEFNNKGLLNPDVKRYGKHLSLKEVIEKSQPEDNPIIVVAHLKQLTINH